MTLETSAESLDELARAFERDGFVNAGKIIEDSSIAELRDELDRYIDGLFVKNDIGSLKRPQYMVDIGKEEGESHYQLCGMWDVSAAFRRLIETPRLVDVAARLMGGTTVQVWSDTVQYKPARGAHFQWHQDGPYHISIEPAEKLLGAWVALDDADIESGCMWMVPGSHRWGPQEQHLWRYMNVKDPIEFSKVTPPPDFPEIAEQFRGAVPRHVKAGEVHFHHALTWHGSPVNSSTRLRRAYTIHYMPEGMRVSNRTDVRVPYPPGTLMTETGPEFPIVRSGAQGG
jgi:phytanoyl-CoA hydroxylase